MKDLRIKQHSFPFKVAMVSDNHNSFGLYQMIVMDKSGECYKTHVSMFNVKKVGETIQLLVTTKEDESGRDIVVSSYFRGHEMTTRMPQVPKDILNRVFQ
jgi:hypothetical protein